MNRLVALMMVTFACGGSAPPPAAPPPVTNTPTPPPMSAAPAISTSPGELLGQDTAKTTLGGARFLAPAGWTARVRGPATILDAPEPGSRLAVIDVRGADADAAVAAAWQVLDPAARRVVQLASDLADRDGWTKRRAYTYQTSPTEHREVRARAAFAADHWTVVIEDADAGVDEKREAEIGKVFGELFPPGFQRESFAGKPAAKLDAAKLAALGAFIDQARGALGVPGVALGVVQDGKVVFAGGFGTRELPGAAKASAKVDAETLFLIASNTKQMTTLMLAKLVERHQLTWDTPVTTLLPSFKLGDADTTRKVMVKHLICACTGLPRQDLEWLFEFSHLTPETQVASLAAMQPTSKFGALFQYSNPLAAAAGFIGGHVAFPALPFGAAYDRAMQRLVFDPLGMTSTTFDFARALRGNHAGAYATDIDGKPAPAVMALNYAAVPLRPAGGAWSNVRDLVKYVQMEIDQGVLGNGTRYIAAEPLLARRLPQVEVAKDQTYGMGLVVDTTYGVPVVSHGGDLFGYHSDLIWLPEQRVGVVIMVNGDAGSTIRNLLPRKLLELVFDGRPEADAQMAVAIKRYFDEIASDRKRLTVPADPAEVGKLAAHYRNSALGDLSVTRHGDGVVFDLGEWRSEVATRKEPDGSISFVTTSPGITGFEFIAGAGEPRTLVVRDGQHTYTFTADR